MPSSPSLERLPRGPEAGAAGWGALLLGFLLGLGLTVLVDEESAEEPPDPQPVTFNHRLHVVDQELECVLCHPQVEQQTSSGLPSAGTCALCHLEAQGETAEEQRLVELLEAGAPLDWTPLYRQPPHVYYSHRRHVAVAEIECDQCHPGMAESTSPPADARPLSMDECMDCHRSSGASLECTACHR